MAPVEELNPMDLDRSNKGASKQRRDQINTEINVLRDLLPLPESSRQRLSQLQVMSLSCVYIRKCNILQKMFRPETQEPHLPDSLDFFQAMTGFLLVTTRDGKLIYISENVTDYLGHSMVDMKTQGDSLFDIVDKRDHGTVQAKLSQGSSLDCKDISEDISFFCRMNMSRTLKRQSGFGDVKVMHIEGHFVAVSNSDNSCLGDKQYVFMASCSPLITPDLKENLVVNNTKVFKTVHQLDMSFMEVTKMAEHHLGYTTEELNKMSWYTLIHPEEIHEAKEKHMQLVRSNHHEIGCMMTVRMIKADGSIFWVNIVMHVKQTLLSQSDEPYIVCINQIISEEEAYQIKVQGQMFTMYPGRVQELWGNHMPNISPNQNFNVNQWIQPEGKGAAPVSSYPCSMPNFPNQPRTYQQVMYPTAISSLSDMDRNRKNMRTPTQYDTHNLVQTDKLKAMLKRKIQGPTMQTQCRPGKVPKMSWDVDGRSERKVYQEMNQPSLSLTEQFAEARHVLEQQGQGQVVQVMLAMGHSNPKEIFLAKKPYKSVPDIMSSEISSLSSEMKVEQVVPDVDVPDSFLTPDPSPISSPEPSHIIKTEVMDLDEHGTSGTSSVCILQALEKLASQPQNGMSAKSPMSNMFKQSCQNTSENKRSRGRELPIFDAFDIDNFFEMLGLPEDSKASSIMENTKIQDTKPDVTCLPRNVQRTIFPMPSLKAEKKMNLMAQPNISECSLSPLPPIMDLPMLSVKTEINEPEVPSFSSPSKRDLVVSSTMIQSPKSVGSQETITRCESLDDLLSSFSDESLDPSPFQTDCHTSESDFSISKFGPKDSVDFSKMSPLESVCKMSTSFDGQRAMDGMSPQSTSSCLSREEEAFERSSSWWNVGMELDVLDTHEQLQSPRQHFDPRSQDGFGIETFDQVDLLLDALVPSQGSL